MTQEFQLQYRNYSIKETARITGMCRAYLYKEIKAGRLRILKCGRRTLVPASSIQQWLDALATPNSN